MKIRLTKIKSSHNNLRTDSVEGILLSELAVGQPIVLTGEALNGLLDHVRLITTTPVTEIEGNLYYTLNSLYEIEEIV